MMTAKTPPPLVPKLRFPEFREAGEWSSSSIGEACEILNNRRVPITTTDRTPGPFPYYGASGIVDHVDEFIFDERLLLIGEDGAKWGAFERTAFIAEGKYWVNNHAHVLRSVDLIDSLLEAYLVRADVGQYVTGAAPPKLTLGKLKKIPIPVPPTAAEQQKIADCLGSLDDLIAAEGRKLEALRQHKQGLMQQLFPQPGETLPRLRFTEFEDACEWQKSTIGERCESFSGGTPDTSMRAYYGGTIPFIRSAEIGADETELFLTAEGLTSSAAKMVKRGDVLVALYGANSGDTALARIDGAVNQAIMCLRSDVSAPFLYHYLTARKSWIISTYLQGGQGNLSGQIVLSVPLGVPHRDEQQQVADCLSALDTRVEEQARRLFALNRHKHGLLQQLFPSPEAG